MKVKALFAAAIVATSVAAGAAVASASTGSVSTPGAKASVSYSAGAWGDITGGTLYDTASGDAKCARLYSQGYNAILGGGGWTLLTTVCGGGSTPIPRKGYSVYSDHVDVKVCAGTSTSASACTTKRLW